MSNRGRHRYPPFFNLSLLDVICNALGAVIFLMFLSYWQANRVSYHLQAARMRLDETQTQLASVLGELESARGQLAETKSALAKTELAQMQTLQKAEQLQQQLRAELTLRRILEMSAEELAEQLVRSEQYAQRLADQLQQAQQQLARLQHELNETHRLLADQRRQAEQSRHALASLHAELALLSLRHAELAAQRLELTWALELLQSERRQLQVQAGQLTASRQQAEQKVQQLLAELARRTVELEQIQQQLARIEATSNQLLWQYDDFEQRLKLQQQETLRLSERLVLSQAQVAAEQKKSETLRQESEKLRLQLRQAEQRFAGVDLSGKKAILLVDTSGSMGKRDPQTDDVNKWPSVCETVRHVLASMPQLEQFQVITFASRVDYPLGGPGAWLSFDRDRSPLEVLRALQQITPAGGTNLHAAFEEAFKYRPKGLDTILLFSDGLPTEGPGLTPQQEKTLGNVERERLLAPQVLQQIRLWNAPERNAGAPARRVRIHAVGFYYDSPNLGNFLWSLARENEGSFVGMSRP